MANVWWMMNPIYDPIFQLSLRARLQAGFLLVELTAQREGRIYEPEANIPTFQRVACRRFMDKAMIACLVLRLRRIRVGYWVDFQP